jgi:hypothetical protein
MPESIIYLETYLLDWRIILKWMHVAQDKGTLGIFVNTEINLQRLEVVNLEYILCPMETTGFSLVKLN